MKIAYLIHAYHAIPSGVLQKIRGQVEAWNNSGHEHQLFVLVKSSGYNQLKEQISFAKEYTIEQYSGKFGRFGSMKKLCSAISDFAPDIVYYRYDLYYPGIRELATNIPVVTEVNSDDIAEYSLGSRLFELYNRLTRGLLFNCSAGVVFVTNELCQSPNFNAFKKSSIVIGNGIKLDEYRQTEPPNESQPRLFFIGSGDYDWHGFDKLIELAKKLPDYTFDIVGKTSMNYSDLPDNMTFYGPMTKDEYLPLAAKATVAISTTAFHRIGLNEASPLKTREYLACGLPTILPYLDTDFQDCSEFLLQLPNSETNISDSIVEISNFVKKCRGKRVNRSEIAHLDVAVKEKQRLEFFQSAVSSWGDR